MKLKYKLILILVFLILASSLPITLFVLEKQESEKIVLLSRQGEIQCAIIARYALNILLQNGGDLVTSRVDAREMMKVLRPLDSMGLVYADTVLLSAQERTNGAVLASYEGATYSAQRLYPDGRVPPGELVILAGQAGRADAVLPGTGEECFQFTARDELPGGAVQCVGRLLFSKSVTLEPVRRLRRIIYAATLAALVVVTLLGLFLGKLVSRPLEELIAGVEHLGGGDFGTRVEVRGGDEIGRLATTFNHLSQVVRLEIDALRSANTELTRLDGIKDEFLATMSHELRTPLYGIIGLADSLAQGTAGAMSEEAASVLALISTSGKRLSHMVNDILDFSRLKHHDIVLQFSRVDLHAATALAISLLRYLIERKSLEVRNDIPPESAFVRGDENRLQQVFLNLIGNAVKFTESGGFTVSCRADPENGDMLLVTVRDTGIGIPADRMDRVFESFEQADPSVSRRYGGTGLGLAVTKKLVELHGGRIWAESEEGRGSAFHFALPAAGEGEMSAAGERAERSVSGPQVMSGIEPAPLPPVRMAHNVPSAGSLLVVDDEPVNLQVLERQLAAEGYRVRTAADGDGALDVLGREGPFDLVLLDVMLPRVSGYEVCRAIRRGHSAHELPVIMLTARNKPGDIVTGFDAGANDYITKPVDRAELLARVQSLVSLKNSVRLANELSLIRRDLNIAHEIQHEILFQELPRVPGAAVAVRYKPMKELGGDFYDVQADGRQGIAVLVADVSGHGVAAAFISAMLKVVYTSAGAHADAPGDLLGLINANMKDYTGRQFITACFARLDLAAMRIRYASAGHWPFVIWRGAERRIITDEISSIPLGWKPDQVYDTREAAILPGDRIVFYTDGIIETRAPGAVRSMFGEARLHDLMRESGHLDADGFADLVLARVRDWSGAAEEEWLQDDVTIVVIDIGDAGRET